MIIVMINIIVNMIRYGITMETYSLGVSKRVFPERFNLLWAAQAMGRCVRPNKETLEYHLLSVSACLLQPV